MQILLAEEHVVDDEGDRYLHHNGGHHQLQSEQQVVIALGEVVVHLLHHATKTKGAEVTISPYSTYTDNIERGLSRDFIHTYSTNIYIHTNIST